MLLSAGAWGWAVALLLAPTGHASRQVPLPAAAVYGAGSLVCHQLPARSFHLHASQLPVCARCTGLYVAGAAGALAGWIGAAAFPRRGRIALAVAALPTAVTIAAAWLGFEPFGNGTRFLAALPLGGAAGFVIVRFLRAEDAARRAQPAPPPRRAAEPHAL